MNDYLFIDDVYNFNTPEVFERICEQLYDLTSEQRKVFLEILQSRIWLYDSGEGFEFERILEFEDSVIKVILRETPIELLSEALTETWENMVRKICKNMSKSDAEKLEKNIEIFEFEPTHVYRMYHAKGKILSTINQLVSAGEIELPTPFDRIPRELAKLGLPFSYDPWRLQARVLFKLSDSSFKALISEVDVIHWADLFWFINDANLTNKVLSMCSPNLANKLMKKFNDRWKGVTIESTTIEKIRIGSRATEFVLDAVYRMADKEEIFIQTKKKG